MAFALDSYPTLTPYLVVLDADRELAFLKAAFNARERSCHRRDDGVIMNAEIEIGNSLVMLAQAGDRWKSLPAAVFVWVPEVDATYENAVNAGAKSEEAPGDKPYGHRSAGVIDANGITWWIGSPVAATA